MTSRLVAVCFDANDPNRLARFWAGALDRTTDAHGRLVPRDGSGLPVVVRPVQQKKTAKNPIHLDLSSTSIEDQHETAARLTELGAAPIDVGQRPDDSHVVLADPEGNEFCILEPGNSFVDADDRLGSITCDGSRDVGHFWSEVLGWPLVWDRDDETAIRAPDGTGPFITWGAPIPPRDARSRHHLDIAPDGVDRQAEVDRLVALGATPVEGGDVDRILMMDPDGTEFGVLVL